jgi:hypothetical protein
LVQTDSVNIVWLINLTSLTPVILTVLDSSYHFSSMRQNSKHSNCQNLQRYHNYFGTLCTSVLVFILLDVHLFVLRPTYMSLEKYF